MPIRIVINSGKPKPRLLRLDPGDTLVGRHEECRLRIPSAEVSRRHCILRVKGDRLIVIDLDSANGTLLNGHFIQGKEEAVAGDEIKVGPVSILVELAPLLALPADEDLPENCTPLESNAKETDANTKPVNPLKRSRPKEDEELFVAKPVDEEGDIVIEGVELFDEKAKPFHLPKKGNLRDILGGLDDSADKTLK
ncbi:MAG TPA: FHA domain-containing protein [Gemmataceae bacterium]|nr:FHA domain-containing protein [Gemmataceae bacterium]